MWHIWWYQHNDVGTFFFVYFVVSIKGSFLDSRCTFREDFPWSPKFVFVFAGKFESTCWKMVVYFVSLTVAGEMSHMGFVRLWIRLPPSSGPVERKWPIRTEHKKWKGERKKGASREKVHARPHCPLCLLFLLIFSCCSCKCYDIIGPGHFDYWMEFLGVMNP